MTKVVFICRIEVTSLACFLQNPAVFISYFWCINQLERQMLISGNSKLKFNVVNKLSKLDELNVWNVYFKSRVSYVPMRCKQAKQASVTAHEM
ncbi:hypothetical protein K1719_045940 [Acacia pycnantha]|nr:hypothetical protein K1719_045940 [Acacia pycnantha]